MKRWTRVQHLLGGLRSPGVRPLQGKSFYLDEVKSRHCTALLAEAISCLGGKVESFLNKDVSIVVSASREVWRGCASASGARRGVLEKAQPLSPPVCVNPKDTPCGSNRSPAAPRPVAIESRGKALLEKAIQNNKRCRWSSVLSKARSWGVKIVHVDDFLEYVERMMADSCQSKRSLVKSSLPWIVKAGALKPPFVKIEDRSRKYRPLHLQPMSLPTLNYNSRFSPFDPPVATPPPKPKEQGHDKTQERSRELRTSQGKPPSLLPLTPSAKPARRKALGYCECCHLKFQDQEEHLGSEQHRRFAQDASHYSVVDQLVGLMRPSFVAVEVHDPPLIRLPSPRALDADPFVDVEPQGNSDTEQAIQNLFSLSSPLQRAAQPTLFVLPEEAKEVSAEPPLRTISIPKSTEQEAASPVLPDALTTSTAVPCSVCPRMMSACGVAAGKVQPEQKKPPEGDSLQMEACKVPEEDLSSPCRSLAFNLWSCQNPRKRSRSCIPSPRTPKKQRTALKPMSDLSMGCAVFPGQPHLGSFGHWLEPLSSAVSSPGEVSSPGVVSAAGGREMSQDTETVAKKEQEPSCSCGAPLADGGCTESYLNRGVCESPVLKEHTVPERRTSIFHCDVLDSRPVAPGGGEGANAHQAPLSFRDGLDPVSGVVVRNQTFPSPLSIGPQPLLLFSTGRQDSNSPPSTALSSTCTEALIPSPSACSPSSDWDRGLLSHLVPPCGRVGCLVDVELLQRECAAMRDTSYESQLCSVLQPSLCIEGADLVVSYRAYEPSMGASAVQ